MEETEILLPLGHTAKILIVDDEVDLEPLILQRFRRNIRDGEFSFLFAHNGIEALSLIEQHSDVDMVVSDINMPEMDGLTLLAQLNSVSPQIKAVVVSAYSDMDNIRVAMNRGAFDFITKPVNFEDLESTIRRTLEHLKMLRAAIDTRIQLSALNNELSVAAQLQQSILPKTFPDSKNLDLYAIMSPAIEIGGDFYDFFWLDDRHLGVAIADVSGKGITGALFMAVARTQIKSIAAFAKSPAECLTKANQELAQDNVNSLFVTTLYGVLDTHTGVFTYANGGHCLPVLLSPQEPPRFLPKIAGVALGVFEEAVFAETQITLKPGEALFFYTDGVSEAMDPAYQLFGDDRLLKALSSFQSTTPMAGLVGELIHQLKDFTRTAPQSDDITCLAMAYRGASS